MFSSFGQQQPQATGGGLFGQPAPAGTSPFGVPPPLPGAAPGTSTGLFGSAPSATPASTSLFGAPVGGGLTTPQPSGLFGSSTAASPFGGGAAPAQSTGVSPFGAAPAATSTGVFGSTGGVFGSTATPAATGMFGSAPSATQPSPFGVSSVSPFGGVSAQPTGGAQGTSGQKYQTTRDTELNMKLVSISAMDYYKNKSFEELRWEDFQGGRGTAGAIPTTTAVTGGWGQPAAAPAAPSGGLFGSTATPSTGGGLFGQPAAAPSSGGMFGAPAPAPSGGLFGTTPTPAMGGGVFGSAAPSPQPTGGLFGSATTTQQPATGGGLFGSATPATSTGGGLFGAQPAAAAAPSGGGLFGAPTAPTSGGLFGASTTTTAPSGGGLFGATTTTPATTGGGLFGSTTPGLFGSTTTAPTPAPAGGGLFGSTTTGTTQAAAGGGLFGSSTTGGGLFGSTPAATGTTTGTTGGGLFGTSTTTGTTGGGGLFGAASTTTPAATGTAGGLFGTPSTTTGGGLFGASTAAGTTGGLFGTSTGATTTTTGATGGGLFGTSGGGLFGTTSTTITAPSGGLFGTSTSAAPTGGLGGLFGGPTATPSALPATSGAAAGTGLGFAQGGLFGQVPSPVGTPAAGPITPVPRPTGLVVPKPIDKDSLSAFLWKEKTSEATTPLIKKKPSAPSSPKTFVPPPESATSPKPALAAVPAAEERVPSPLRLGTGGPSPAVLVKPKITYTTPTKARESLTGRNKSVLPVCANHNLWLKPSIEAMSGMTDSELSRIEHFQIGQYGVGSVTWPGITDVRFLVVDDIIQFRKGAVTLFPDEELKPPVGTGLNKTAIIELFVKPKNYELAKKYEARYVGEMKKLTEDSGAEFLSYDLDTWRFRVEHFSTWGIDEMEWDRIDLAGGGGNVVEKSRNDLSVFSRIEREVTTPVKVRHDSDLDTDNSEEKVDQTMDLTAPEEEKIYTRADFIGALAVPPPTREELKAMGWDLKVCDLFLNQSFRASIREDNSVVFPEHPVVYDSYKITSVKSEEKKRHESDPVLLRSAVQKKNLEQMIDLLDKLPIEKSVFTLIDALIGTPDSTSSSRYYPSGSPMSDHGEDKINTSRFNEWLSRSNAATIESKGSSAFNPAAALTSRHYTPTASELLIASGNPRLALVAAAAANETSRQLMKPQLERVECDNKDVQDVYKILGGNLSDLSSSTAPDWRSQLALRYWYGDGDLTGFEPPEHSIEWRIIKTVVMGDSKELLQLIDSNEDVSLCLVLSVARTIRNIRPDLVSQNHFNHIVRSCADRLLEQKNWQWSVICLSLLPKSDSRDRLMFEIVAKNVEDDCSLVEEFGVLAQDKLVMARAMHELGQGNVTAAKDLLSRHGLKKLASTMADSLPSPAVGRS